MARHQPDARCVHAGARAADAVRARGARSAIAQRLVVAAAGALLSGWYLNELLLKLVLRADPQPAVFDLYARTLDRLRDQQAVAAVLRGFERDLLVLLGFGLELGREAQGGAPLQADRYYHFHPSLGFVATRADAEAAYAGRSLLALADDDLQEDAVLEDARRLMRTALDDALEGRELRTRSVARAVTRSAARAAASAVAASPAAQPAVKPPSGERPS